MFKKLFNKLFNKTNFEPMSFKQGFDLTELPVITLYQGDKKFNFLLDTGSNDSIIDKNILGSIEHTVTNKSSNVFGFEGNKKAVPICSIVLTYKNNKYEYDYLVSDMAACFGNIKQETGVTLHGIIGSKFFNQYKYVIDFDELIAYSKA